MNPVQPSSDANLPNYKTTPLGNRTCRMEDDEDMGFFYYDDFQELEARFPFIPFTEAEKKTIAVKDRFFVRFETSTYLAWVEATDSCVLPDFLEAADGTDTPNMRSVKKRIYSHFLTREAQQANYEAIDRDYPDEPKQFVQCT